MTQISTDRVTVLIVCPPGLEQKSLFATLNAVPAATVISRVAELEVALRITQMRKPDLVVVDATLLTDEAQAMMRRLKQQNPDTTLVALIETSTQKSHWRKGSADYAVEYYNLNREFPLIVRRIQAEIQARLMP